MSTFFFENEEVTKVDTVVGKLEETNGKTCYDYDNCSEYSKYSCDKWDCWGKCYCAQTWKS